MYILDIKEHFLSLYYAQIKLANLFQQKNGLCGGSKQDTDLRWPIHHNAPILHQYAAGNIALQLDR